MVGHEKLVLSPVQFIASCPFCPGGFIIIRLIYYSAFLPCGMQGMDSVLGKTQ